MEIVVTNKPYEIDQKEKVLMELINGRPPANEAEVAMVAQLEEMKKKGEMPYIPSSL